MQLCSNDNPEAGLRRAPDKIQTEEKERRRRKESASRKLVNANLNRTDWLLEKMEIHITIDLPREKIFSSALKVVSCKHGLKIEGNDGPDL